eukprot:XP_011665856.1 PREDICTED: tripartite motif-containing protein 5-like [Strongylocentrotus purpuratus]
MVEKSSSQWDNTAIVPTSFTYTLHAMASRFPPKNRVQLRARKGHDMKWSCDIHGEPIKFYCKEHNISICHPCATKDHKPCELDDIADVILERRRKLDDKQHEIEKTKKQLKTLDSKIKSSATSTGIHFQTINDNVKSAHKEQSRSVKDKHETKIRLLNEKADEEIRIINEKKDREVKTCNAEMEKDQLIVDESLAKVLSETKAISEVVAKEMKDLTSKNQHKINSMHLDDIDAKIKRITQDDKTLVKKAPRVLASLDDNLNVHVHQDVIMDCLDRIEREVQRIKFVEGEVGGKHYGRIDGYTGKWELVKSINIPSIGNISSVRGLISDDEIFVLDVNSNTMYCTNISTEHTNIMPKQMTSCVPIGSNVIVSGRRGRDDLGIAFMGGHIIFYDRQWNVLRTISIPWTDNSRLWNVIEYINIPWNNRCCDSVYVDVDRDGMILATQEYHHDIYVMNPADGEIVNTITMQGKVVRGKIQALSSGDIVVKTSNKEFTIISRSGQEKVTHCAAWSGCSVDKLTDTLYITNRGDEHTIYAVDQVSCEDIIQPRKIVEHETSKNIGPCLVTPTGNLVAYDGDKLLVYKKRFIVL